MGEDHGVAAGEDEVRHPVRREFINELGNRIVITVARDIPDPDALCSACRWRGAHAPTCRYAGEAWPRMDLPDRRALVRIEGPSSVHENFLTPMELAELTLAVCEASELVCNECAHPWWEAGADV